MSMLLLLGIPPKLIFRCTAGAIAALLPEVGQKGIEEDRRAHMQQQEVSEHMQHFGFPRVPLALCLFAKS